MAHVASGICFSRAWFARKRADAPPVFLRDCDSRSRVLERVAGSCSSCTFHRAHRHDRDRGGMGNSIRPRHDITGCDRQMVGSVHRTAERHRFQILRLDPKRTAWPDLLSPVGSSVSVCTIFKTAGGKRTATGARVVMGNRSTVFGSQSCPRRARPVQHAGNSSSIVAIRHDLRRQRVAMAASAG